MPVDIALAVNSPVGSFEPSHTVTLAGPPINRFVPVNQRKREFETKIPVTSPNRLWFGEVTGFLISKQRYWTRSIA
jgi:hypothetical protein